MFFFPFLLENVSLCDVDFIFSPFNRKKGKNKINKKAGTRRKEFDVIESEQNNKILKID